MLQITEQIFFFFLIYLYKFGDKEVLQHAIPQVLQKNLQSKVIKANPLPVGQLHCQYQVVISCFSLGGASGFERNTSDVHRKKQ